MSQAIDQFIAELQRQEVSKKTIDNYQSDLLCFARWFRSTIGEAFTTTAVTPTDIRDHNTATTVRA